MVMSIVKPIIFDGETNRPMTADEYVQWQKDNAETQAAAQAEADALAAKQAARQAVLDKLGLTADEVQALLG